MPRRKVLLRVLLWSIGAAALLGVWGVLTTSSSKGVWRIFSTAMLTGMCAGLMLAASAAMDNQRQRCAGLMGMAVVVAEFAMALWLRWVGGAIGWQHQERVALTMWWVGLCGF